MRRVAKNTRTKKKKNVVKRDVKSGAKEAAMGGDSPKCAKSSEGAGSGKSGTSRKSANKKKDGSACIVIDKWEVLDAGPSSTRNSSVGAIATRMMVQLQPLFERIKELDGDVVIELQPPVALQQFHYLMHELHGMALGFGLRVRFQQARQKERAVPDGMTSRATDYASRKAGAIADCETWLKQLKDATAADKWMHWFLSNLKKDDAADALLHAAVALPKRRGGAVLGIDVGITHLGACILIKSS
jgi:hypothetical protein